MAKEGFFDIETNKRERKCIGVIVAEEGLVDEVTGEVFEFTKVFSSFIIRSASLSFRPRFFNMSFIFIGMELPSGNSHSGKRFLL